ncbi:MerR family transcriptional regulator [Levilactobacillus enshiensis]|uniref:MerR family transcriptional regulator n=1 Tax=Levilactobacillus enshiensis TaxID=2590213 RepID=UPI00117AD0EE|nr:MerR family transcriptional regulator [Levilactobacillus enshiensis]
MMNTTEFCRCAHTTRDTLRFYDTLGILKPQRLPNNYRDYTADDLNNYQIIQNLKAAGISLSEIAQILALRTQPVTASCRNDVLTIIQQNAADFAKQQQFYAQLLQITNQMHASLQAGHQEQLAGLIEQFGRLGEPAASRHP